MKISYIVFLVSLVAIGYVAYNNVPSSWWKRLECNHCSCAHMHNHKESLQETPVVIVDKESENSITDSSQHEINQ